MDAKILVSCEAAMSAVAIFEAETGVPLARTKLERTDLLADVLRRADGARRCLYQDHVQSRTVLWGLRSPEKTSALVGGLQQPPDTQSPGVHIEEFTNEGGLLRF
ncbi:hypothetical protein ISCGN_019550 [Ixodes scapularis]